MHGLRLVIVLLLCSHMASGQHALKKYRTLDQAEKRWVKRHLFVARKALHISQQAEALYRKAMLDSIIIGPENGGNPDAYRHALWMAMLTQGIGKKKAIRLGKAHEEANYSYFLQHRLEYGELPDSVSGVMDLLNNETGAQLGLHMPKANTDELHRAILQLVRNGKLYIIKTKPDGVWLMCDGTEPDQTQWQGQWSIPKCLVPSY